MEGLVSVFHAAEPCCPACADRVRGAGRHGGSTEVIARVNAPTEQTASAQPFTEPASPADNTPVQTGSSGFWIIASVIFMTTAWLLIVRARSKSSK